VCVHAAGVGAVGFGAAALRDRAGVVEVIAVFWVERAFGCGAVCGLGGLLWT
jgi:hypothetical protein